MRSRIRWLWRFWRPHAGILPILFLLTVLSSGVALAFPLVFREIVNAARALEQTGASPERSRILDLTGILLLVGLGRSLRNLYPMLRARMNGLLEMAIRRTYFERVLEKGSSFFLRFRTGDVVTRLTEDIASFGKLGWFICSGIFRAVESIAMLGLCVAAMLWIDWRLGLIALAPLPFMMALFYIVRIALGKRFERNQRAISQSMDLLESCYSGIRIVKAYNAEERLSRRLTTLLEERIEIEMRVVRMQMFLDNVYMGMASLGRTLTLAFGGFRVIEGTLELGSLYAIYLYVDQLVRPMMDIPQLFISGKQAFVGIDRLEEMSDYGRHEEDRDRGGREAPPVTRIEMDGVDYRFGEGTIGLEGVSLRVERGRKVAIVGPVGSGKTTLARILSGELRPDRGRVLVNGTDLADLDLTSYRRRVGYIPQEALLFSDTVRENVVFGRNVPDLALRQALRDSRIEAEVMKFPRGVDELLGQRGVRVSGGQRQRLAVARAIVSGPDLLVMDDVTAALDAENEEALWDAIEERDAEIAAVIITHRIATARRADEILVLDEGRVVDRGSHEELLGRCDLYRRLAVE